MWVLIWKILQTFTKIFLLNVSIMPDINHGRQFGKNSLGHATCPDDDWRNFLYPAQLACSGGGGCLDVLLKDYISD